MKKLLPLLALGALLSGCKPSEKIPFGCLSVSPILDGTNSLENALFTGDASIINALAPDGHTPIACNVFLVGMPDSIALIDTGYGGDLQALLKARNISPGQIHAVLITHSHFDHVGGLMTTNGAAAFPNATLYITAAELEFWKNLQPPLGSSELAAAVEKAYKIEFITPDEKTPVHFPCIVALDASGHTPGHVVFRVWDTCQNYVLIGGDLLHSDLLQFSHPEIYPVFDNDKDAAYTKRTNLLTRAANNGWFVHFSHVKENGSRRVKKDGDGFKLE